MTQYILPTIFLVGYKHGSLLLLSLLSISFGISTIISKNPVFSVLFLIALFANISIYLILVGLDFIGLSYLLVYIGAISILFIMIIMLINIRISELLADNNNSLFLGIFTLLCFNYLTFDVLPYSDYIYDAMGSSLSYLESTIDSVITIQPRFEEAELLLTAQGSVGKTALSYSPTWDTGLVTSSHVISIGNVLYTNFFSLLMVLSLILLLAMVGAIIITTNKSNKKTFDSALSDLKEDFREK